MSAHAALVSLRHILVGILYTNPRVIHSTAQLQTLLEEAGFLLNFLDASSTHIFEPTLVSLLETKMRAAARKAEDFVEFGILAFDRRRSYDGMKIVFYYCLYAAGVFLLNRMILVSYVEVIPVWIQILLVEVVMCAMSAVLLYIHIRTSYVIPALNDAQKWRRIIYEFKMIVKEAIQIKEAGGEPNTTSSRPALIALLQILESVLDSGGLRKSDDRAHLKSLQEMVTFLLDFLGNDSPNYMPTTLQNLDLTIVEAISKAKKALAQVKLTGNFSMGRFSTLENVRLLDSLLIIYAFLITLIRLYVHLLELAYWGSSLGTIHVCLGILWQLCLTFPSYLACALVVFVVLPIQYSFEAQELPHVVDDFSIIVKDVIEIKDSYGNPSNLPTSTSFRQDSISKVINTSKDDAVVGLDSDLMEMKARLFQDSSNRQLISIVGMGGVGKTTLARRVYKDPAIDDHFDVCAWVTVSQKYSLRSLLLSLLDSAQILTGEEKRQDSDDNLALHIHQYLMSRRYLIVMDDVWDAEIWDFLSRFFPENYNGSRVLLTSRLPNVASGLNSSSHLHHMRCLSDDDSWCLLRGKVFGAEDCPDELKSIGREIARSCGGLPLAVVVTGGLLCKDIRIEFWRDVAEKWKKSELQDIKEQCLEILGLSYKNLPHHLRPCFLYAGVLLGDSEILISKLINLWVAEGFLEPYRYKTLEEVAEDYIEDLVDRNLILVCKRSCNGKIRTCSMHDLLRDVCVQTARHENFLHVVESDGYMTRESLDEPPRRLSIHVDALRGNIMHDLWSYYYIRSVLYAARKSSENRPLPVMIGFVYLRVLDVLEIQFGEFPHPVTELLCLRYFALHYGGYLPASISKLQNLETLIVHHHCSVYPLLFLAIWTIPNLRHIYVRPGCILFNPLGYIFSSSVCFLSHLQTLVGITNFKWTKGIIKRVPNLKKLGILYYVPSSVDWAAYQLDSLADLHQLETLKIIIEYKDAASAISGDPPKLAFPEKLKKLSLSGCRIPWECMTAIGELPNLEALKLRCNAFFGPSWETAEGEFPKLVFLLLEKMSFTRWETDADHFPRLQRLVLRTCVMLEEIPFGIGDIPTLEFIHLVDCHTSAEDSAKYIQKEQEDMGNEVLKFHIEQWSREVDELNMGNSEARGEGWFPGSLQLHKDTIELSKTEMLIIMLFSSAFATLFGLVIIRRLRLIW